MRTGIRGQRSHTWNAHLRELERHPTVGAHALPRWVERLQIEKRPVEQTGSTGQKILEALETGVQPPIEPAIVETTHNGRSRAPPAGLWGDRDAWDPVGGQRAVLGKFGGNHSAPRGEVTNLPAISRVWDDPFKGYWGPGSGVRSKRGISPTAAGSRRQASQDEAPWESVEVERIRH